MDDESHEAVRDMGLWSEVLMSLERTKAVFVMGAAVILLGVIAIWWYAKRLKSS